VARRPPRLKNTKYKKIITTKNQKYNILKNTKTLLFY
jgi:hypothetical protein